MPTLSIIQSCPDCGTHVIAFPVANFGEATKIAMCTLLECARTDELASLMRDWLKGEGESTFDISFVSLTDDMISLVFVA
jgi:hypothetical protein